MNLDGLSERILEWPDSWKRSWDDIFLGEIIIHELIPFFRHLVNQGLAEKTIRKHFNNIWLLGGEIVDEIRVDYDLQKLPAREILLRFVDSEGGPLSRHNHDEEEQRSFDSSCKKLYKFLINEILYQTQNLAREVQEPNATSRKAIAELEAGKGAKFKTVKDWMADLDADD